MCFLLSENVEKISLEGMSDWEELHVLTAHVRFWYLNIHNMGGGVD